MTRIEERLSGWWNEWEGKMGIVDKIRLRSWVFITAPYLVHREALALLEA